MKCPPRKRAGRRAASRHANRRGTRSPFEDCAKRPKQAHIQDTHENKAWEANLSERGCLRTGYRCRWQKLRDCVHTSRQRHWLEPQQHVIGNKARSELRPRHLLSSYSTARSGIVQACCAGRAGKRQADYYCSDNTADTTLQHVLCDASKHFTGLRMMLSRDASPPCRRGRAACSCADRRPC